MIVGIFFLILNDNSVGKTSLMSRYINQKFTEQFKATIGADLMPKEVVIDDRTIKLQVFISVI